MAVSENATSGGRTVVVGSHVPPPISIGEDPGGSNQAFGGKLGLTGHEDATLRDHDGRLRPEKPDALWLVEHS